MSIIKITLPELFQELEGDNFGNTKTPPFSKVLQLTVYSSTEMAKTTSKPKTAKKKTAEDYMKSAVTAMTKAVKLQLSEKKETAKTNKKASK